MAGHKAPLRRWVRLALLALVLGAAAEWGGAARIHAKAKLADYWIAQAWARQLRDENPDSRHKPWSWADTWPVARLQWLEDEQVLEDLHVLAGAHGSALAFAPGHLQGTALPGEGGAVLAAHRDTHFAFLQGVQIGQRFRLQNKQGQWLEYRVRDLWIADERRDPLLIDPDRDALWLVTCYPFDAINSGGPLRYVVYLERAA